ncbi:hypothetical protein HYT59_01695 [Candidatus Woesebacteria bacterium]|nr:hypothetical protein [Candidatus Woesebacteria bacterium]
MEKLSTSYTVPPIGVDVGVPVPPVSSLVPPVGSFGVSVVGVGSSEVTGVSVAPGVSAGVSTAGTAGGVDVSPVVVCVVSPPILGIPVSPVVCVVSVVFVGSSIYITSLQTSFN